VDVVSQHYAIDTSQSALFIRKLLTEHDIPLVSHMNLTLWI